MNILIKMQIPTSKPQIIMWRSSIHSIIYGIIHHHMPYAISVAFVKKWGNSEAFAIDMDYSKKEDEKRKKFWKDYIAEPYF